MVKYGSFVEPGRQLQLNVEMLEHGERESTLRGEGSIDGQTMVKINKLTLTRYNLRERDPALHTTDKMMVAWLRDIYATLRKGSVRARAVVSENSAVGRPTILAQGGQDGLRMLTGDDSGSVNRHRFR